jgi:regulatory protein
MSGGDDAAAAFDGSDPAENPWLTADAALPSSRSGRGSAVPPVTPWDDPGGANPWTTVDPASPPEFSARSKRPARSPESDGPWSTPAEAAPPRSSSRPAEGNPWADADDVPSTRSAPRPVREFEPDNPWAAADDPSTSGSASGSASASRSRSAAREPSLPFEVPASSAADPSVAAPFEDAPFEGAPPRGRAASARAASLGRAPAGAGSAKRGSREATRGRGSDEPLSDNSDLSGTQEQSRKRGRRGGRERGDAAPAAAGDPREEAREICLRQLAVRPRTRAELATAMRKRGVEDEIAAEILDRYDEVGIIDDAAFARAWVASRHHGRGLARRALAGELRRKGVSPDEVGEALEELAPDVEEATARAMVARRLRVETRGTPEAVFRRLVGMLGRKGYPPGLAIRLVKEALAEREDAAEFADGIDPDALADAALDPDN